MPAKGRRLRGVTATRRATLAEKTAESLGHLELRPEDAGIATLALEYAETIDRAAALANDLADAPYDPDTAAQVARLRQRVEAHVVMSELGPKLLAALDALGATPKARAAAGRPPPAGQTSKLTAMRGGAS